MYVVVGAIVMAMMGPTDEPAGFEPEHARNPVYMAVLKDGLQAGGATARLPEPRFRDGQDAEAQRAALREVAGTDQKLDEMARDSVTAPYIIKVHDLKAADATIRVVDLWFVVHADIAEIDPAKEAAKADEKEVEAGNMVMRTRLLKPEELRAAGITSPASSPEGSEPETWYAHIHGRLLDRIAFDVTNQVVATRTRDSLVVAVADRPRVRQAGPVCQRLEAGRGRQGGRGGRRLEALSGRHQLHQDQPPGVPAGGPPRRDARGLRRAARMVPGGADPPVEVQHRRPGPDPQPPPGAGASEEGVTAETARRASDLSEGPEVYISFEGGHFVRRGPPSESGPLRRSVALFEGLDVYISFQDCHLVSKIATL